MSAVRASDEPSFRSLVAHAAVRYRAAGRHPYYFTRSKLRTDPVFAALLRDGRISPAARIVDVGCGIGVLPALLAAAEECASRPAFAWPSGWAPPPQSWTLHGFDLRASAIETGRRALSDLRERVVLEVGDARTAVLPACDVVLMLDMLHYMEADAQSAVLRRAHAAMKPSGTLLIRVADAAPTSRFRLTLAIDWLVTFGRGTVWPRLHCRPLRDWMELLEALGFAVTAQPMSEGTPFANALLIATKPATPLQTR